MFDFPAAPVLDQVVDFPEGVSYKWVGFAWNREAAAATPPPPLVRPTVTSISPEVVGLQDAAPTTIVVTGADFDPSCRAFVGVNPMPTTFISATQVSFPLGVAQAGWGQHTVSVEQGGLAAFPPAPLYVINNPNIVALIPPTAPVGGAPVTVRLDGNDFADEPYCATVITLDGVDTPTTYNGSDNVTFTYTPTTAKAVMVQIHNGPVLSTSAPVPFTVTALARGRR
jgi:hypothetical protein